jgi:hypothetical protein
MLVVVVGLMPFAARAADMGMATSEQLKIAIQHAGLAQSAGTVQGVRQHLQHVVNCIEGPRGSMFAAGAGNPCEGKGNGAMADAKAAGGKMANAAPWLELANEVAVIGIKAGGLSKAKAAAWTTHAVLEHATMEVR